MSADLADAKLRVFQLQTDLSQCQRDLADCADQRDAANATANRLRAIAETHFRDLEAANARIAELERRFAGDKATFERLVGEKNAANARAEAAEQGREYWLAQETKRDAQRKAAEAEAAALHAELDEEAKAYERARLVYEAEAKELRAELKECRDNSATRLAYLEQSKVEAASLRAEVERLRAIRGNCAEWVEE